jgi:DNA repair protein RadD
VLRPAEGKPDAIVLDHSGAVFRHGFAEDRVEWTLDPDYHAESPTHQQRCAEHSSRLLECTQCGAIRVAGEACFYCGFLPQWPPRAVVIADGNLALVDGSRRANGNIYDPTERTRCHAMLISHRRGARIQTRLGGAQVQRKIWHMAVVGRFACADSTNSRS